MSDFNLADCTTECQQWFVHIPAEHRAEAHRVWHEGRAFRAEQMRGPFRRWYERASLNEVEQYHDERGKDWTLIRRCQQILVLPFGHSRICCWLNGFMNRAIQARQDKRDNERFAAMRKHDVESQPED